MTNKSELEISKDINSENIGEICESCERHQTAKLMICNSKIDMELVSALSKFLKNNRSLNKLTLNSVSINNEMAEKLFEGFRENKYLNFLGIVILIGNHYTS